MAKIAELNVERWNEWVSTRPTVIQKLCRRLPPDRLYRFIPTGQRVTLVSYSEDGTVKVAVSAQWNLVVFERHVFGIDPKELEECDLPTEEELTGAMLTEKGDVDAFCDLVREDVQINVN